jgi:hypothetical protein
MPGNSTLNCPTMCFFPWSIGIFFIADVVIPLELASHPPSRLQDCAADIWNRQEVPILPFSILSSSAVGMIQQAESHSTVGALSARISGWLPTSTETQIK